MVSVEVGQQVGAGANLVRVSDPLRLKAESARPDLKIHAEIELERLPNVLSVESPAAGQENSTPSLLKVVAPGQNERTPVQIGRRSVQFVEVVNGLIAIADYIETFYNRSRRYSYLGGVSPEQFEAAHKRRKQGVH